MTIGGSRDDTRAPWDIRLHDLMPFRVREILLVSSPYDAFTLEEDGRLGERLFLEYSELNLPWAPRITQVSTGAAAREQLARRRFDLVITMMRVEDIDAFQFGREVRAAHPELPVVLLSFNEAEVQRVASEADRSALDGIFVWTGDAGILTAIIKLIEDKKNVDHDVAHSEIRVIIVVEDSARRYSSFLTLLYAELMSQSASLIAEGLNEVHKLARMRARPKILLATSYEQAVGYHEQYEDYVFALITDVRFPRGGVEDPNAGFDLVRLFRSVDPDLPVLMQSAQPEAKETAVELGVVYANKRSSTLHRRLRAFVTESLGFGDFVFRLPDRTEVARARNVYELETLLRTVPAASVELHALHNHFSRWLEARTMFGLAQKIRPLTIGSTGGVEGARDYIIARLKEARRQDQGRMITNFSDRHASGEDQFVRLGKGSIGGKARGVAFVNALLSRQAHLWDVDGIDIRTPLTVAIGTDDFDRFMESTRLFDRVQNEDTDAEIIQAFLEAPLPKKLQSDLEVAWRGFSGPIAVRSSSLLEDAQFQPFAGVYHTYMLPNEHPNPIVRFDELCRAVKAVYASAYCKQARAYIEGTPYALEDEKMGVLIQEIVGQRHGPRWYPHISGVALSYNYYPLSGQRPEDGLALVALGLGQMVVSGGAVVQFSPKAPAQQGQFPDLEQLLAYSQRGFYALDMSRRTVDFASSDTGSLVYCDLGHAEADGTLHLVGSTYDAVDDRVRDDLTRPGPRIVTFNNILGWGAIPLAPAIDRLLTLARQSLGCPVEVELAVDVPDGDRPPCLYVLQIRPQTSQRNRGSVDLDRYEKGELLCRTARSLGDGPYDEIYDLVYIPRSDLDGTETPSVAREIAAFDAQLRREHRPYLLLGPGRWGSSDAGLGVPVDWSQIAGARVIVETDFDDRMVEPSQGSHFFHNVTALQIGYLTVHERTDSEALLDRAWLEQQPTHSESEHVRHLRFGSPLGAYLDGRRGRAVIVKPGAKARDHSSSSSEEEAL